MYKDNKLYVAHSADGPIHIIGKMANRHGLIAGAKTMATQLAKNLTKKSKKK